MEIRSVHFPTLQLDKVDEAKEQQLKRMLAEQERILRDMKEEQDLATAIENGDETKLVKCRYCKKELEQRGLRPHEVRCTKNPNRQYYKPVSSKTAKIEVEKGRKIVRKYVPCPYCGEQFSVQNLSRHQINCDKKPTVTLKAVPAAVPAAAEVSTKKKVLIIELGNNQQTALLVNGNGQMEPIEIVRVNVYEE